MRAVTIKALEKFWCITQMPMDEDNKKIVARSFGYIGHIHYECSLRPVFDAEVLYPDIHVFHHHFCHTQLSVFCAYLISRLSPYKDGGLVAEMRAVTIKALEKFWSITQMPMDEDNKTIVARTVAYIGHILTKTGKSCSIRESNLHSCCVSKPILIRINFN
jgi:hypothetical protein